MSSAFVSKSRRVRFDLHLRIVDLNNVPLVSGTSFIKWHLPSSTAAEHRGRTNKCAIKDHRVAYEYERTVAVRLTVGKDGMLQECSVHFEVLQEYSAGGRGERIKLGDVKLNLAEYVEASEVQSPTAPGPSNEAAPREEGITRRYLMQDSKINSTLKIGIHMRHVEGTRDYYGPPLRTAPVFGGIAGIMSSSEPVATTHASSAHANGDAAHDGQDGSLPNLSSHNKEMGEMQDMYRRTLAAYWSSQPGELKADDCIEDVFSGGDGWGKSGRPELPSEAQQNRYASRPDSRSGTSTPNPESDVQGRESRSKISNAGRGIMSMGGRHHKHSKGVGDHRVPKKGQGEIDEFDVRDDLRSWGVKEGAYG